MTEETKRIEVRRVRSTLAPSLLRHPVAWYRLRRLMRRARREAAAMPPDVRRALAVVSEAEERAFLFGKFGDDG